MYRNMRVYNILFMNWLRVLLGPFLFTASSALVCILYVSVRPSGLPLLIHIWVPCVAAMTAFMISWLWYDIVLIKRLGDEVLESLQSNAHKFLWSVEPPQRKCMLQWARSSIKAGPGDDRTVCECYISRPDGPFGWSANQCLFLLSLWANGLSLFGARTELANTLKSQLMWKQLIRIGSSNRSEFTVKLNPHVTFQEWLKLNFIQPITQRNNQSRKFSDWRTG